MRRGKKRITEKAFSSSANITKELGEIILKYLKEGYHLPANSDDSTPGNLYFTGKSSYFDIDNQARLLLSGTLENDVFVNCLPEDTRENAYEEITGPVFDITTAGFMIYITAFIM